MRRFDSIEEVLKHESRSVALVVGNGVNLVSDKKNGSWKGLLSTLASETLESPISDETLKTISLTEFYDLLGIQDSNGHPPGFFQRRFCDLIDDWRPNNKHEMLTTWAHSHNRPILTTNFDQSLSDVRNLKLFRKSGTKKGFTDFYPWDSFFSDTQPDEQLSPHEHFGIWHINGFKHYKRSIRLGLTHYMGSVERARNWLHKGERRMFQQGNEKLWLGYESWLQIFFNSPLLIFGLALNENEVFLRWMLIERAIYFKKYPHRRKRAWYVAPSSEISEAKKYFLEGVKIECLTVDTYQDIYSEKVWANS